MNKQDLLTLFDYSYWARDKILVAASLITPEQFSAAVAYSHGSLQAILAHMASVEWLWRSRVEEGVSPSQLPGTNEFLTVDSIRDYMLGEQQRMMKFINDQSDEQLNERVSYQRLGGQPQSNILWHILEHMVNHGTQHRSDAAWILTSYNRSPGDLDFIFFVRAREAGTIG